MRTYLYKWVFFCTVLLLALNALSTSGQAVKTDVVTNKLSAAKGAAMSGFIGQKLAASYENRVCAQDFNRLVEPFKHKNETELWQSEFWGKWLLSAIEAYRYHPTDKLKTILDSAVYELLRTQTPDGYIGNYAQVNRLDQWDIWGQKYCMLGLLAYYGLTKDSRSLMAVQKMADYLIRTLKNQHALIVLKGNYKGMAATSILEPITILYQLTRKKAYLSFAEQIVQEWEQPDGPQLISRAGIAVGKRFPYPPVGQWVKQGQKAYEMMSCYEGLLNLYRITGNQSYLTAVTKTWQSILDTEINVIGTGSASECWYGGKDKQQLIALHSNETCVTSTWIGLSLQLLKLTREAKYADAIEQSYYNALLGAMTPDGATWGMYSPLSGVRTKGPGQCGMDLDCCIANGPRGLFSLPLNVVMAEDHGIMVNFYNSGRYEVRTPTGALATLDQQTDYPVTGDIQIHLKLKDEQTFTWSVRIPKWSTQTMVKVNGVVVNGVKSGAYLKINRKWKNNDKVEVVLDMRGREVMIDGEPSYLAIQRGPIVLARDLRASMHADLDETITPVLTKDGFVPLKATEQTVDENIWMAFTVPCLVGSWRLGENAKPVDLVFYDYSSAGNTFSNNSLYRVWFPQLIDPTMQNGYIVE